MTKKNCELCGNIARMYCESDEASLCWNCDTKVHCANFLVAKHSRNLLCHLCQSPTPWTASGPKLSPTLSVCTSCLNNNNKEEIGQSSMLLGERVEENYETETDDDDDEYYDSDDSEFDDEDAENQVVPLSSSQSITCSPARSSTSCSSYESARDDGGVMAAVSSPWKRSRESDYVHSEGCCSSDLLEENKGTSSIEFLRPMKLIRTNELCDLNKAPVDEGECIGTEFNTDIGIVSSFLRFQQNVDSHNIHQL